MCDFYPLPGRKVFDGRLTKLDLEMFSEGRFRSKLCRRRGVAVELATPRQAGNVSHSRLIGGVGVSLF